MSANYSHGTLKDAAAIDRERVRTLHRIDDLNREMMRLPEKDRRKRWMDYYRHLNRMMSGHR